MANDSRNDDALAAKRYWTLQLVRLGGIALTLVGILVFEGRISATPALGYVMFAAGALGFFFLPRRLAKAWRSPDTNRDDT